MERKTSEIKENLLPTSLLNDIEYDDLDKELQLMHISNNCNIYIWRYIYTVLLGCKEHHNNFLDFGLIIHS